MNDRLMKHPKNIKGMAYELRKAIDMYWGREISETELKEILFFWAAHEGRKLFKADRLNPTVAFLIGRRREELFNKLMSDFKYGFEKS